ncbi:DUF86 domain-containing protein [Psychrosphaera aquimarina]|uniref:DUF86 domain-containing protein n=1 Tax=Psychrosphaera aquimarina TaxID=2044854 RepID=A0ABU3R4G0_9GAMM|nr:DUF86 domain-containing protein [Psychrosphaera aquimarina]MDU0114556.1 DUF86 domain-containing protein [Psychrosphaera aquimarina]
MLSEYIDAMQEQTAEVEEDLQELSKIILDNPLSKYEYRAAERLLQIYVGSCIGIAKHCIKKAGKNVPNEAYASFEKINDLNLFTIGETENWHKIVGLRNVLVHDYLNIDRRIIDSVLINKHYQQLSEFIKNGLEYLGKEESKPG